MTAKFYRLGVRFAGPCGVCGRHTGDKSYQMNETCLYRTAEGKYVPVHTECANGKIKHAVGGGAKFRTTPDDEIEVR